ncbi:hypothetical protein BD413DRAFT_283091 [Trametes elegans]|nr:hypothetical protein BD413DRAFT_283091 [Trametes elegans]
MLLCWDLTGPFSDDDMLICTFRVTQLGHAVLRAAAAPSEELACAPCHRRLCPRPIASRSRRAANAPTRDTSQPAHGGPALSMAVRPCTRPSDPGGGCAIPSSHMRGLLRLCARRGAAPNMFLRGGGDMSGVCLCCMSLLRLIRLPSSQRTRN